MKINVVLGTSAVGLAVANLLAEQGEHVRLVSRSGAGPDHPLIERIAADATQAERLSAIAEGTAVLYNCASPPYDRWPRDWPLLNASILVAAERSGAVLAVYSNLYGYGPGSGVMSESTPLAAKHPKLSIRADMWREARSLHESGRICMTEVRGSDHLQPNSMISLAMFKPMLEGKRVISPIPIDIHRSWTSVRDSARLLTTVANDKRAYGHAWHVPSYEPMTARELLVTFARLNHLAEPKVLLLPWSLVWALGMIVPMVREIRSTRYQFSEPFIMDSRRASAMFGQKAEPLDCALLDAASLLKS